MRRFLAAVLVCAVVCSCGEPRPPESAVEPSRTELAERMRSALVGAWLRVPGEPDVLGSEPHVGVRFDATGRWQLLVASADGSPVPMQDLGLGDYVVEYEEGKDLQVVLQRDAGGTLFLLPELSSDSGSMAVRNYGTTGHYVRTQGVSTEGIPRQAALPSEAELLTTVEGVWLFAERDVSLLGGTYDGVRFDASGQWQMLDLLEDGRLVPAQRPLQGTTSFTVLGAASSVQQNLHVDGGGSYPLHTSWSADRQSMNWQLYLGLTVTLRRSSATVDGAFPPRPFVPGTTEQGLAAVEGVWLFAARDTAFLGGHYDGVRFSATGRWQLLDVLEDGSLAPSQDGVSGATFFVLDNTTPSTVQMDLPIDAKGTAIVHAGWSADLQRMTWNAGGPELLTLARSDATVAAPFPPLPFIPTTEAEGLAALQGTWLFSTPDVTLGGVTCDGLSFDATGAWQMLDVLADGRVVPSTHTPSSGSTRFDFQGSTTHVVVALVFDGGGMSPNWVAWSGDQQQLRWSLYLGPTVTLQRVTDR